MGNVFIDETGNRFGLLTVLERDIEHKQPPNSKPRTFWKCRCDCGNVLSVSASNLRKGHTLSCGCYHKARTSVSRISHGMSRHPDGKIRTEYNIWVGMKQRCYNKNRKAYDRYGGRGISVCDSWRNSFENFYKDMGARPSPDHSIDRIDNNGPYEPSNCRWATYAEQSQNRRFMDANKTGIRGVRKHGNHYQASISANNKKIYLGQFKTLEEASKARKEAEATYWN